MIKNKIKVTLLGLSALMLSGCSLDQKFYTESTPDDFFTSKKSVYSVLSRPFTHLKWYVGRPAWYLQELTTDEMVCPVRGQDWDDGGSYQRLHYHNWAVNDKYILLAWEGKMGGIARSLEAKEDLQKANYEALGMTNEDREDHQNQLNSLLAYFYKRNLDAFGGIPLYTSTDEGLKPRATDVETFEFIEEMLLEAIPKLYPKTQLGAFESGYIKQAAAAALLAQLYFNAVPYAGEDRFAECEVLCQDIIDGKYGTYKLEDTWHAVHGFNNDKSTEMIWTIPSDNTKAKWDWYFKYFYHYEGYNYFDTETTGYNGFMLAPSLDPQGNVYASFNLGNPYVKYHDEDLRKKPYRYFGNGKYEGMFQVGPQRNPNNPNQYTKGTREYNNQLITLVDQVARYSEVGGKYPSIADLPSTMRDGEESSGIRLVKSPQPNKADISTRWNPDAPLIRLAEIYYMLAECKLRKGDKATAANLINEVRARNFDNRQDPDPVTSGNLDMYRMLDEWMIEFLGESDGRRRTDLIRWGVFSTEEWWDHQPTNDKTRDRFPIPAEAFQGNQLLTQNPGYPGAN